MEPYLVFLCTQEGGYKMIAQHGVTQFQLTVGDTLISSKSAYIKEVSIEQSRPTVYPVMVEEAEWCPFSGKDIPSVSRIQSFGPAEVEVTLTMCMSNEDFHKQWFMGEEESTKLRKKKVEDCTPRELLYAARQKLKETK